MGNTQPSLRRSRRRSHRSRDYTANDSATERESVGHGEGEATNIVDGKLLVSCHVCFELYGRGSRTPLSLVCGHTFCQKCLDTLNMHHAPECPECRMIFRRLDCRPNYSLLKLVDYLKQKAVRDIASLSMDPEAALPELQYKPKSEWVPDKESDRCLACHKPFTFTRRRHHCRYCGELMCHPCSSHTLDHGTGEGPVRCCVNCFSEHCVVRKMKEAGVGCPVSP